jgi:hypothetical protein
VDWLRQPIANSRKLNINKARERLFFIMN